MPIVNVREFEFVFSLNKQATIETSISQAALNKQRSIRTFAPITEDQPAIVSDVSWFGKGHSQATFRDVIQRMYAINSQERSATSLEALYAAAYVMGSVATSQPDTSTNPNEYEHIITWQDPSINKEVLYTSIGEIMGAEYKKLLQGAWIDEFTMTGNRDDHVVLSFTGGGRRYVDGTFTAPGLTTASFFKTLFGTVLFGPANSPVAISSEVLSWTITVSQNPQLLWLMGNTAGDETLLSEVLIGDQHVTGSFVIKVNVTHRNRFLNQDAVELVINCISPDTIDNNKHSMEIRLHNLKIASEDFSEEGQTVAYTLNFDAGAVLKTGGDEHLTITFVSDIDSTELLVASP